MKVNINFLLQSLSLLGFVLCFFVFLIYHLGIYSGFWNNFFPNYFGFSILLIFLFYILFILKIYKKIVRLDFLFIIPLFFLFLYSFLITILNYNFEPPFQQSIEYLVMFFTLFIMGFYLKDIDFNNGNIIFFYLLIIVLFLILKSSILQGRFSIAVISDENASGYQGIARNFLAFFLMGYCLLYKNRISTIYLFLMIFILFLIGARSEFSVFMVVSIFIIILDSIKYKKFNYFILLLCTAFIFSFILKSIDSVESRQLQLLNIESSTSWSARNLLNEKAKEIISKNWFYGDFGSHVEGESNVGLYAHNLLSGYVNYGLVYFLIYIYMLVFVLVKSFQLYWNYSYWLMRYSFMLNLICFLLVVFSKPIFWPLTYLAWGVFSGAFYVTKFNKKDI